MLLKKAYKKYTYNNLNKIYMQNKILKNKITF